MSDVVIRIAVDAMGGDFGPRVTIPAAVSIAAAEPGLKITLVGDEALLKPYLDTTPSSVLSRIDVLHAKDQVLMDDKPAHALRHKQQSSMWLALNLLRDRVVDACVSAGNTGALMAIGRHLLSTYSGIDRPAICKPMPALRGHCYLLDLGANVNCSAEQMLQFAIMGSVLSQAIDGVKKPEVGLLSNGEEANKGNGQIHQAHELLSGCEALHYTGYVEGGSVFNGKADVIVCDGFVGNAMLKASEGAANYIAAQVKNSINRSWYNRLLGLFAWPLLCQWRKQFDPGHYNGAGFLGLQGSVIKSHGSADKAAFARAILVAKDYGQKQIPERINHQFHALREQGIC